MKTTNEISAIPTVYNGVQLKSRMESKVALLLDKLGWKWEYEPFSVMLDGINYTPDFYVPKHGYVIECRGYDSDKGRQQIERFAAQSVRLNIPDRIINLYGVIGPDRALVWDSTYSIWRPMDALLCGECGLWGLTEDGCNDGDDTAVDSEEISVSNGQIFFGCDEHPPESWDRVDWTVDGRDQRRIEQTKTGAIEILKGIGIGKSVAQRLEKCPIVPTRGHTDNKNLFRFAILVDPGWLRGFSGRAIMAAITLTGMDPKRVLVTGSVEGGRQ